MMSTIVLNNLLLSDRALTTGVMSFASLFMRPS